MIENWPCGSGEKDFKHLQCIFCYFLIIYPWKKVLHINKFELPLPKYALYQVWLKLAESFSKKYFVSVFSLFRCNPSFKKQKQNLNPLHPRMLSGKFGWNWPSGSYEKMKTWTVYRDRWTKAFRKAHSCFQLRWAYTRSMDHITFVQKKKL